MAFFSCLWLPALGRVDRAHDRPGARLDLSRRGEPKRQLVDYLRQKQLLLVLDNYEHLSRGEHGDDILEAAPGVKVLVTSRPDCTCRASTVSPLRGWRFQPSPPAALPHTGEGAGRCCALQRRQAVPGRRAPGAAGLSADGRGTAGRGAHLSSGGGYAVGILLAQPGWTMLTPAEIVAEIGHNLDFLETELRDAPDRQRSLRAAFDHSWHLLSERERAVFAALSVFRGGFTREVAEQVAGASLRELMALADKSLLHRTSMERYELHELLRQYAAEKLGESPDAEQAVRTGTAPLCRCAGAVGGRLKGPRQQQHCRKSRSRSKTRARPGTGRLRRQVEWLYQAMEGWDCSTTCACATRSAKLRSARRPTG